MLAGSFFTVVTPVFRTPLTYLDEAIASVERQTFGDWQMILVDDGNDPDLVAWLHHRCGIDPRLRVVSAPHNVGIALASQLGVDAAGGAFLALLDHDDLLSPVALERVHDRLTSDPTIDYVYTDEDKVTDTGDYFDPFFKPDWSPERFRHHMYTCHLSVLRAELVRSVGGFRPGYDGSQDHDLVLRVVERARTVAHVPEVLYHWRAHMGSTAALVDQKPAAWDAGRRAVEDHCRRTGINAEVLSGAAGSLWVRRRLKERPLVSLVIPTYGKQVHLRGRPTTLISHLLASVDALTTYDTLEIVVVGDRRMDNDLVMEVIQDRRFPVTYVDYEQPSTGFSFSNKINVGATRARGDVLVLLNDDMEVLTPSWIEEMLGHVEPEDVGAVGGAYYFEDETIQHAGVVTVLGAYHLFYKFPRGVQPFGHHLAVAHEVTALTGACLAVRRSNFVRVGGFSEALPNNFNDVDFCLKLRAEGLRNIWTPHVELYHFESQSRVNRVQPFETDVLRRRWGVQLLADPYYNPNCKVNEGRWEPYDDWDRVSRAFPAPVLDPADVSIGGYLEVNPDLLAERDRHREFDPLEHARQFARREGRLYVRRWSRPAADRNARQRALAATDNFTVDGYLAANPDLAAHAAEEPRFDAFQHLLEHGIAEGRYVILGAPVGTDSPGSAALT